jgi:hypothetical protein
MNVLSSLKGDIIALHQQMSNVSVNVTQLSSRVDSTRAELATVVNDVNAIRLDSSSVNIDVNIPSTESSKNETTDESNNKLRSSTQTGKKKNDSNDPVQIVSVKQNVSAPDTHDEERQEYMSYNHYLIKREQLYPYMNDRYKKLYNHRCTLLSHWGRVNEYYRFGLLVKFTSQLYSSGYSRFLQEVENVGSDKESFIRRVKTDALLIPALSYHVDEAPRSTVSDHYNDLRGGCITLQIVPYDLQYDPPSDSLWYLTPPSLTESYLLYLRHVQLKKISVYDSYKPVDSSSTLSSSSSSTPPSLEHPVIHYHTPTKIEKLTSEDEGRYFGVPYPKTREQAEAASIASIYNHPESHISRVKREQEDRLDHQRDTHHHRHLRKHHVLKDVIDSLDDGTRMMCQLTTSDRMIEDSQIHKHVTSTIASLDKFNGDPEKAPLWYQSFILSVVKINYTQSDVITILDARMTGGAKQWLSAALVKVSSLAHNNEAIPALLGLFREQYMNKTHIIEYRDRLNRMKITDVFITPIELRLHYTKFTQIANNLKICDKFTVDSAIRQMFVESLPRAIRNYIGVSYKDCESVDAVFQLAEEACRTNERRKKVDLDGEMVKLNSIHAASYQSDDYNDSDSDDTYFRDVHDDDADFVPERDIQHLWVLAHNMKNKQAPLVKQDVNCWHCGRKGHYAGECPINIEGLPQTPAGNMAYAAYNKMRGEVRTYNARQELDRSERIRKKRDQWTVKSNRDKPSDSKLTNRSSFTDKQSRRLRRVLRDDVDENKYNDQVDSIAVESHVVEVTGDEDVDDVSEDGVKHVVRLSSIHSSYKHSSLAQIQQREQKDRESGLASSICLPIEINGVSVGDALCDQGATKTIMRASALDRMDVKVKEHQVKNHYVVCADGGEIPIRSRFNALITSKGKSLGDSLIYVVDDKTDSDITCDMVLGRSTMASSKFNCIDTKKGTLFNRSTGDEIQCLPAQFIEIRSQKHIVPRSMKTVSLREPVSDHE